MEVKMMRDSNKAKEKEAKTYYRTHIGSDPKNSPTAGNIWNLKETPGWNTK